MTCTHYRTALPRICSVCGAFVNSLSWNVWCVNSHRLFMEPSCIKIHGIYIIAWMPDGCSAIRLWIPACACISQKLFWVSYILIPCSSNDTKVGEWCLLHAWSTCIVLDTLGESKYFQYWDLASGYRQVEVDAHAQTKTAFITHQGLYEFIQSPFGLCNAPATFKSVMQVMVAGMEWRSYFVYIDDILNPSPTFEEHLLIGGFYLKVTKCLLLLPEVPCLGHVIFWHGIQPDSAKTEMVKSYPTPLDVTKVSQFLSLVSYYCRFVQWFAKIVAARQNLLKRIRLFIGLLRGNLPFISLRSYWFPVQCLPTPIQARSWVYSRDKRYWNWLGCCIIWRMAVFTHHIAYASWSLSSHEKTELGLVWAVQYIC